MSGAQSDISGDTGSTSSKFGFTWPSEAYAQGSLDRPTAPSLSSVEEGESENSEDEDATEQHSQAGSSMGGSQYTESPPDTKPPPAVPRFTRAFSMPLPSQLGHLTNPLRTPSTSSSPRTPLASNPESPGLSHVREFSLELADTVQMVVQTLLQISPPQVLDPAKEQFSACSLAVPTPSMSAMFTSMKNLNYISANMVQFCQDAGKLAPGQEWNEGFSRVVEPSNDFDTGEMLQSVGDALSGVAAQAGVDLVLFHGDVALKHMSVTGQERGISYTLSHIIRQVINTTQRGDSIEIGLFITNNTPEGAAPSTEQPLPLVPDGSVRCVLEVSHKFNCTESNQAPTRTKPYFETLLLRCLLGQIDATLTPDLKPKTFPVGRACELALTLERASSSVQPTPHPATDSVAPNSENRIAEEPTLEQLAQFVETLKGMKVTLYASAKGSFAHHLTSYLTAWGLDVSHASAEAAPEGLSASLTDSPVDLSPESPLLSTIYNSAIESVQIPITHIPGRGTFKPTSFIMIDDDVNVLRERLQTLRVEKPYPLNLTLRKRPSLAANHRPRSSPHLARSTVPQLASVVVVHFTSLSNYKSIKDVIQSVLSYSSSQTTIPEVLIIPKPAGPRRFLTALHTAVTRPLVDPYFAPIATSPLTPHHLHPQNPFFNLSNPSQRSPNRPAGSRTNSDRSTKSVKDPNSGSSGGSGASEHLYPPPSPLGNPDNVEYFSDAPVKLGSSPSSGLVIQSPDGQPAGIFFHPRAKTSRSPSSSLMMERDKGQLFMTGDRRGQGSRRTSEELRSTAGGVTFSSLHAAQASPKTLAIEINSQTNTSGNGAAIPKQQPSPQNVNEGTLISPGSMQIIPPKAIRRPNSASSEGSAPQTAISPPGSPANDVAAVRRAIPRRTTLDSKPTLAAPLTRATALGDTHVVPPICVLVVDDNPINQTILVTFMKKKKIKHDVASNGQQAVEKWRTGTFHLILMDIQMPIMDGIQATKEIRRLERLNANAGYPPPTPFNEHIQTPSDSSSDTRSTSSPYRSSVIIVALTASSLQSDRVAALAAGCNDFLTKPVSLLWLNNKIIEWGSIKALQMWADIRTDAAKTFSTGQAAQARSVAEKLHVPKGRTTPSPGRTSPQQAQAAATSAFINALADHDSTAASSTAFWNPSKATTPKPSHPVPTSPPLQRPAEVPLTPKVVPPTPETLPTSDQPESSSAGEQSEKTTPLSSLPESEASGSEGEKSNPTYFPEITVNRPTSSDPEPLTKAIEGQ